MIHLLVLKRQKINKQKDQKKIPQSQNNNHKAKITPTTGETTTCMTPDTRASPPLKKETTFTLLSSSTHDPDPSPTTFRFQHPQCTLRRCHILSREDATQLSEQAGNIYVLQVT